MGPLERFFGVRERGSSVQREVMAGVTTFLTMAYIIVVNPGILAAAGLPQAASATATILAAAFGTLLMGLYARRPFAVAPLMGENAFIAFTVVGLLGYSWQAALGAVFVSGMLFIILTLARVRVLIAEAIPFSLKMSFAVGIGLFLAFIGLTQAGIVLPGVPGAPLRMGDLSAPPVLLAAGAFLLTTLLMIWRVRGAIIIGILVTMAASIVLGVTPVPAQVVGLPGDISAIAFQLDIPAAFSPGMLPVMFTVFVMVFVDTLATLFGLSVRAGLLDEKGNLPQIERPMLIDAAATSVAALLGTTTSGAYIESAAGIEAGGKTGLTALVVALLFLAALFFTPLVSAVPPHAYGPALVVVGLLMLEPIRRIPFDDQTELVPSFLTVILMVFTFNIGIGMTAGFVAYPLIKVLAGRGRDVRAGMWFLGALSLLFFVLSLH